MSFCFSILPCDFSKLTIRPYFSLFVKDLILQLLLECLNFSAACFSLVTRNPVLGDQQLMDALEKFILEQLSLTEDLMSEIKVLFHEYLLATRKLL